MNNNIIFNSDYIIRTKSVDEHAQFSKEVGDPMISNLLKRNSGLTRNCGEKTVKLMSFALIDLSLVNKRFSGFYILRELLTNPYDGEMYRLSLLYRDIKDKNKSNYAAVASIRRIMYMPAQCGGAIISDADISVDSSSSCYTRAKRKAVKVSENVFYLFLRSAFECFPTNSLNIMTTYDGHSLSQLINKHNAYAAKIGSIKVKGITSWKNPNSGNQITMYGFNRNDLPNYEDTYEYSNVAKNIGGNKPVKKKVEPKNKPNIIFGTSGETFLNQYVVGNIFGTGIW